MPIVQKSQGIAAYRHSAAGQLDIAGGLDVCYTTTPSAPVESAPETPCLNLSLRQNRQRLSRLYVSEQQAVRPGMLLAEGEQTQLYCPCSGVVQVVNPDKRKRPGNIEIILTEESFETPPVSLEHNAPLAAKRQWVRQMGVWDSIRQGMLMAPPALNDQPNEIIVRCVFAEPGQIPGSMVIRRHLQEFIRGLKYLYEIGGSYAPIVMTVPVQSGSLGRQIREQLRGQAFVHISVVPIRYPVDNPLLLATLLGRERGLGPDHFWVVDPQTVIALTSAIEKKQFWSHRYVAIAGPAVRRPVILNARVGAPVGALARPYLRDDVAGNPAYIRGGLYSGKRAVPEEGLRYGDYVIWVIPETEGPELLGWMHPGHERPSWTRTVLSGLLGKKKYQARTLLRGAKRPCIGCGFCRQVCPAGLYPHQLHRLVTHDCMEEAEQLGLLNCVECYCCSYGCVSKLELAQDIIHARRALLHQEAKGL